MRDLESISSFEYYKRLKTKDVQVLLGYAPKSRTTLWRHIKQKQIPQPRYDKDKPHAPWWYFGELLEHMHNKSETYGARERVGKMKESSRKSRVRRLRDKIGI